MVIRCSHCGEELLGAVNRCWRCGAAFNPQQGSHQAPPVRLSPTLMRDSGEGAASTAAPASVGPSEEIGPIIAAEVGPTTPQVSSGENPRRGSPFAAGGVLLSPANAKAMAGASTTTTGGSYLPPAPRAYSPSHPAAVGGAIASVMLGVLSLIAGWFTAWALVTCILGVAMGVWGVYSSRRRMALVGIGLCFLALLITGANAAARSYAKWSGGGRPLDSIDQPLDTLD